MSRALPVAALAALLAIPTAGGTPKPDYARVALNVLPPGQSGSLRFPRPRLGPLTERLKLLIAPGDPASSHGSSYYGGWYSYVVRDLSQTTPVFCGNGDRAACRASLWAALEAAGAELTAAQGPDPAAWRADARPERITFGFLPKSMRWTNRPTFQQVISFDSHRPR